MQKLLKTERHQDFSKVRHINRCRDFSKARGIKKREKSTFLKSQRPKVSKVRDKKISQKSEIYQDISQKRKIFRISPESDILARVEISRQAERSNFSRVRDIIMQ